MTFLSQTVIGARFRIQFYPRPGQLRSIVGFNPINRPLPAIVESHEGRVLRRCGTRHSCPTSLWHNTCVHQLYGVRIRGSDSESVANRKSGHADAGRFSRRASLGQCELDRSEAPTSVDSRTSR